MGVVLQGWLLVLVLLSTFRACLCIQWYAGWLFLQAYDEGGPDADSSSEVAANSATSGFRWTGMFDAAQAAWIGGTKLLKYGELLPGGVSKAASLLVPENGQDDVGFMGVAEHTPMTWSTDAIKVSCTHKCKHSYTHTYMYAYACAYTSTLQLHTYTFAPALTINVAHFKKKKKNLNLSGTSIELVLALEGTRTRHTVHGTQYSHNSACVYIDTCTYS